VQTFATVNTVANEAYSFTAFDGLGRAVITAGNHPGSAGGYSARYTIFDSMGRAAKQSNPAETNGSLAPTGGQKQIYAGILVRTVKQEVLNWQGGSVYSTTVNTYNARDQITQVRQFQGSDTSSVYQDTDISYDGHGRLKTRHTPEQDANTVTTFSYNADDTVLTVTDARGASQTLTRTSRGMVTGINYTAPAGIAPSIRVSFQYDAAGNRILMTDGLGSVSYQYDQLSRMTSEARTFSDPDDLSVNGTTSLAYAYNLATSVMGGQVLIELAADGAKTRRLFTRLAKCLERQRVYGTSPAVEWDHCDLSDATFRITILNGDLLSAAELDPTGADTDTHSPLNGS